MTKHLKKIETGETLAAWRDQLRKTETAAQEVRICMGGSCLASGAPAWLMNPFTRSKSPSSRAPPFSRSRVMPVSRFESG